MRKLKLPALLVLLAFLIAFPWLFSNPAITSIAIFTLIFAAAATAWNIFVGYTGYVALGHGAFFGIGAYAIALMAQDWNIPAGYTPFALLPLVGLVVGVISVPLGWIALRTRRHTFVVITIAIFFITQLMAYNLTGITNGSSGLSLPIPDWSGDFYNIPFYFGALAILLLAFATSWWVRNSKFGLGLLAIRDDEDRALGLGVKTTASKLVAFVISAIFVGMLGGLYAYFIEGIFPAFVFDPLFDIAVALMSFLGGLGTLAGPILGAFLLEPIQQYLALQYGSSGLYLVIYGVIFLVIILIMPQGIIPTLRRYWIKRTTSGAPPQPGTPDALVKDQEEALLAGQGEGVNS